MFVFNSMPVAILIIIAMVVVFVSFVCITMSYLRFYFNRYEPVYIKTNEGMLEKNPIASRFCKIIISNTITNQCLTDSDNVGLWLLISNTITSLPSNSIVNITELHKEILLELSNQLDEIKYERMSANLIKLELAIDSNLLKSKINTPPYLCTEVYALWISRVLGTLNKT